MAAIEQTIPNLLGGVSQQPDPFKLPGQVRFAENVMLDPTFGAMKRPGSELILRVNGIPEDAKWFPIFRDEDEHYMCAMWSNPIDTHPNDPVGIRIFDMQNGVEATIANIGSLEYFRDIERLSNLTIGDYTLLSNSSVQPSTWGVAAPVRTEALVLVKAAAYATQYIVNFSSEASGQQARYAVQEMQAPPAKRQSGDSSPNHAGETTITDWNGTGLSFRLRVEARSYLRDGGEKYGHVYTPYVTLLTPGNSTTPFPSTINVAFNGESWDVKITKQQTSRVYANLGTAQYTTPVDQSGGGADVATIVNGLLAAITGVAGFQAESTGNVIRVWRTDGVEFTTSANGGQSGESLDVVKYSVTNLAELPVQCWNGYTVAVRNTDDSEVDDYYVTFRTDSNNGNTPGNGHWIETVKPGDGGGLNTSSMPHVLVRDRAYAPGAVPAFTISDFNLSRHPDDWAERSVGSADTNPHPSFTESGSSINGMFMYKNRLGFLTRDAVVMSQVGDYFNFYATSGVTISDADPIDLACSDTKPVVLQAAITSTSGAILFGNQAQFRLASTDDTFGPKTANLDKISNYNYDSGADPVQTGVSMMFPSNMGSYSSIYELSTESVKGTPVIEDSSRVIPRYIPANLTWSNASIDSDMAFFGDGTYRVQVFRFFNEGQERKVAGWVTWTFYDDIKLMASYSHILYSVKYDPGTQNTFLCRSFIVDQSNSPIYDGTFDYIPRVDKAVLNTNTLYLTKVVAEGDFRSDVYDISADYEDVNSNRDITVVYTDNSSGDFERFALAPGEYKITVDKDRPFIMGLTYHMTFQLPRFFVNQDQRPDRISEVILQGLYFDLYQSSGIEVQVDIEGYDTYAGYLTPTYSDVYIADSAAMLESTTEYMGMAAPGSQTLITFSSYSPYPSGLTSYHFQGIYNKRGYATIR